jgi:murein DD-endopeptidase MepM/ murein hydrolase activator NlpD
MKRLLLTLISLLLLIPFDAHAQDPATPTHYNLGRPIPAQYTTRQQLGFPYGWTRFGRSPIHHGIDLLNRLNTPVIAAAEGTVFYAGPDSTQVFGAYANFYGNIVVIQHALTAPEGGPLYTLYGHLSAVTVQTGQHVTLGQQIGAVGKEGIALWYHLHFEVRVGNPHDYNAVRNPELWLVPLPGTGKLIGRMVDANGGLAMGIRMTIGTASSVIPNFTYAEASIPSDPTYNENFVVPDLAAGCYRLRVKGRGKWAYDEQFCIKSGETKFMLVQLKP